MMKPVQRIHSQNANPVEGQAVLDPIKLIWTGGMMGLCLCLIPFFTNWPAVILGVSLTYVTLLFGHSVGMHRMMIHRSFKAVSGLKYLLIYTGTVVGIGGPSAIIRTHDVRDWAQRQPHCHDFFSHDRGYIKDITWQLFYKFNFKNPPVLQIEPEISEDSFFKHLDKYWRWHQFLLAGLLFWWGGLPFIIWGVCFRIVISTIGHWTVTYFCHNPGPGRWEVATAGVQASNLNINGVVGGLITHGECWHNNHHAFPESAQIGLETGEFDPAWIVISGLHKAGLIFDVTHPRQSTEDLIDKAPLPNV